MIETLDNYKKSIIDLPISYTWRGHGSAIFIEIGELTKEENRNYPKGEYSVMLDCEWRIEGATEIECGSCCGQEEIESSISSLVNQKISNIELVGALPEIAIWLSSGKKVLSFTSDAGHLEWAIFLPDKTWLCSKGGSLVREKNITNSSKIVPLRCAGRR